MSSGLRINVKIQLHGVTDENGAKILIVSEDGEYLEYPNFDLNSSRPYSNLELPFLFYPDIIEVGEGFSECKGSAHCFRGIVTEIVDGDTIDINNVRVRLSMVYSREWGGLI